jgi:hypothetical protein
MGKHGDTPGVLDDLHSPPEFQTRLGFVEGFSLAQIMGKGLFLVFYDPPVYQEGREMGPPDRMAPGQGLYVFLGGVYTQFTHTVKNFEVPLLPEPG